MKKIPEMRNKTTDSKDRFYNLENDDIVDSDQDVFELQRNTAIGITIY